MHHSIKKHTPGQQPIYSQNTLMSFAAKVRKSHEGNLKAREQNPKANKRLSQNRTTFYFMATCYINNQGT